MYEIFNIILGITAMFIVVGGLAYLLQNRAKQQGNLFTQPPSPRSKIIAFVVGLVFAVFFLIEILYEDRFHVVMPILSILLFLYSFGYSRFIEMIQKRKE